MARAHQLRQVVNSNGTMYFGANDGIWDRTVEVDGTEAGTVLVKDIDTASNGTEHAYVDGLFPSDGGVYFYAEDGVNGFELWKSDRTRYLSRDGHKQRIRALRPEVDSGN